MARKLPVPQIVRTVDEALFRFLVGLEVAKAQRLQYCVSVLSVTIDPRAAEVEGCSLRQITEPLSSVVRSAESASYPETASSVEDLVHRRRPG